MNIILNVFFVVGIIILIYPKPIKDSIKNIGPFIFIGLLLMGAVYFKGKQPASVISITATGERNSESEGNEIWVKEVQIDGKAYSPKDVFEGWIWKEEDSVLVWRDYDKDDIHSNTIKYNFSEGSHVKIFFGTNRWRGIATISSWKGKEKIDFYSNSDSYDDLKEVDIGNIPGGYSIDRKDIVFVGLLCIIVFVLFVLYYSDRRKVILKVKDFKSTYNPKRILSLDIIKIISAFMIVLIHSTGEAYNNSSMEGGSWYLALFLNVLPRFAVPAFIMVSGILLLGRDISVRKAINRAVMAAISLIFWSVIYISYSYIGNNDVKLLRDVLSLPFKRGPSGHLWYGYIIVWIYLFIPILNVLYKNLSEKMILYFIVITVILPSTLDLVVSFFKIDSPEILRPYSLYLHLGYIGMMFLGKVIYDNKEKLGRFISILLIVLGFVGTYMLSLLSSVQLRSPSSNFISEMQLSNIIYAVGIVMLACVTGCNGIERAYRNRIIGLSNISLGVYFSHPIFLWIMNNSLNLGDIHLMGGRYPLDSLIFAFIYYILSLVLVYTLSKIPYLSKVVKLS